MMNPKEVVHAFIKAVNAHDLSRVSALLTDGHIFIDAHDHVYQGKEIMRDSWKMFFSHYPDYRIEVQDIIESGNTVVVFGHASGTPSKDGIADASKHWRRPAAWKAKVSNELVQQWQVFVDTQPMMMITA